MTQKAFLCAGTSSNNYLFNPFYPETDVEWTIPENFPEENVQLHKDENGHLHIQCKEADDVYVFICNRGDMKQEIESRFVRLPEVLEIPVNGSWQFPLLDGAVSLQCEMLPEIGRLERSQAGNEWKLMPLQEGYATCTCVWGEEKKYKVQSQFRLRIIQVSTYFAPSESSRPGILASPDNARDSLSAAADSRQTGQEASGKTGIQAQDSDSPADSLASPNSLSGSWTGSIDAVPELRGPVFLVVRKKNGTEEISRHSVGLGKSLVVGRASGSAPLAVDVDLAPHLSRENRDLCSRNQLRVFISNNRVYVKNIGSVDVELDDGKLLPAGQGMFLAVGRQLEIAGEIALTLQEG